jgi:hypothetical protein
MGFEAGKSNLPSFGYRQEAGEPFIGQGAKVRLEGSALRPHQRAIPGVPFRSFLPDTSDSLATVCRRAERRQRSEFVQMAKVFMEFSIMTGT